MKKHIRIFNKSIAISVFDTPNIPTLGITNECEHIPAFRLFMDYDNVDYEVVSKDIIHINKLFKVCNFILLTTGEDNQTNAWGETRRIGNYHVMSCDVMTYNQINTILEHARCDNKFKSIVRFTPSRNWVLRISSKYEMKDGRPTEIKPMPELLDVITFNTKSCKYKHCWAQYMHMIHWFDIPTIPFSKDSFDSCKNMEYIQYYTLKKKAARA